MSTGSPVVLCLGPERWFRDQAIGRLKEEWLAPGFEETDFIRLSGPESEPQAILEAARTAPFGSPRRMVLLDGWEDLDTAALPWLAGYLKEPTLTTGLVLCADEMADQEGILAAAQRAGKAQVIRCLPLKGGALKQWVIEQARGAGKGLSPEATDLLIGRVGEDLPSLALALEGLILLVGSAPSIGEGDVEALVPPSAQETAFDILEAAGAGESARAVAGFRAALGQGRITLDQFFGAAGWAIRRRLAQRRLSGRQAEAALGELLRADVGLKQGHPSPELLVEQILLRMGR